MEEHEWRFEVRWIKAQAGHRGIGGSKGERSSNKQEYRGVLQKIPKSLRMGEQNSQSLSGGKQIGRKQQKFQ